MSVRTRVSVLTAATLASALMLSGCGGGASLPTGLFSPPSTSASSQAVPGAGVGSDSGSGSGSGSNSGSGSGGSGTFSSDCLGVASAFSTIALAMLPSLGAGTGSGTYNSAEVAQAISSLGGSVPAPLKGDFQTLSDAAKSASGKNLADAGQILGSPAVSAASDDISKWMTANCGG